MIKRQLYDVPFQTLSEATIDANREMVVALRGADFREGVASFVEKRPPRFRGMNSARPVVALRAMPGTPRPSVTRAAPRVARRAKAGGARRDRTADLVIANDALSQLSYGPVATGRSKSERGQQSAPFTIRCQRQVKNGGNRRFQRCFCRELPLFAGG